MINLLSRKIEKELKEWKLTKNKKALLIKGARQVGKTTSIQKFGKENYKSFIELNFERNPEYKDIFSASLDANSIILNMSAMGLGPFIENNTLIFFDEIQSCPNARVAVKFLVQDGRFDYIESGSLLGINFNEVSSYPVGFETQINMHSLDFEEFLWARNISNDVIDSLKKSLTLKKPINKAIHNIMMRYFREYIIVGGMPAVVNKFVETYDINVVIKEQMDIINSYRDDIKKYAGKSKIKVQEIFDSIPSQLNKKNKRYYLSMLSKEPKMRTYEDSIMWLFNAEIAIPCYNVASIEYPLLLNVKRNLFKVYMKDIGLLVALSFKGIQKEVLNGDIEINKGSIIENALADVFKKKNYKLYYYNRKKPTNMEIDFVIQKNKSIIIIEAKSGSNFKEHPSLTKLVEENKFIKPIVYCIDNIHESNGILYLPYYLSFLL
ncbi:MAG: hypothetical protein B6I17_01565 [Tenericutes bacterium 4572_104]|nr:MAG: hypothetical protein B6I17_01565 [Tenericutes bacterium 4572_104]